jgi:hypothetical protein
LAFLVTNVDDSKQLFIREKIVQTWLKTGADSYIANEVAELIGKRLNYGIKNSGGTPNYYSQISNCL